MPTNVEEWAGNGLRSIQHSARNSAGVLTGFANLAAADEGDMAEMRKVVGAVTAPAATPETTDSYNRGENGYIAGFNYDAQPTAYGLVHEATDLFLAAWMKRKALAAIGRWDMLADGGSGRLYQDVSTLITRDGQSMEAASKGSPGFDQLLIMSAKYTRRRGDAAFQAAGEITYNGIPNRVQKTPWGESILTTWADGDDMTLEWWSEYPCTLFCFVGDGTIDDIPLPFTPHTAADSVKLWNSSTGALLTISDVDEANKLATVSAAPAAGLLVVGMLESPEL